MRFRFPEAQGIGGVRLISKDSHIVWNTGQYLGRDPADAIPPMIVGISLSMTAEAHIDSCLRTAQLPGITQAQPFVCDFNLPAVANLLPKDSEFVTDAVPDCGNFQSG
jgi:hypothetical protein